VWAREAAQPGHSSRSQGHGSVGVEPPSDHAPTSIVGFLEDGIEVGGSGWETSPANLNPGHVQAAEKLQTVTGPPGQSIPAAGGTARAAPWLPRCCWSRPSRSCRRWRRAASGTAGPCLAAAGGSPLLLEPPLAILPPLAPPVPVEPPKNRRAARGSRTCVATCSSNKICRPAFGFRAAEADEPPALVVPACARCAAKASGFRHAAVAPAKLVGPPGLHHGRPCLARRPVSSAPALPSDRQASHSRPLPAAPCCRPNTRYPPAASAWRAVHHFRRDCRRQGQTSTTSTTAFYDSSGKITFATH